MIAGPTLRKLAQQGKPVFRLHYPAGPTSPAFTNHYATRAQRDRELAVAFDLYPDFAPRLTPDDVPAASLDLSAPFLI